jgi:hypothetical protein
MGISIGGIIIFLVHFFIPGLLPYKTFQSKANDPIPSPSAAPSSLQFSYFHTEGSQILDYSGAAARITGVTW